MRLIVCTMSVAFERCLFWGGCIGHRRLGAKATGKPSSPKGNNIVVSAYLVLYNAALAAGWAYVLFLAVMELVEEDYKWEGVYKAVEWPLKYAQTIAVFEVVHAILGKPAERDRRGAPWRTRGACAH